MEQNEQLINLVSAIKHISLNHEDLMDVSLEYSTIYFKEKKEEEKAFDKYWIHPKFIEQTVLAAREGIVLAMQAITLDDSLPFNLVVANCVDLEAQRYNEILITERLLESAKQKEINKIQDFLSFLRKQLFSRVFSQNKELQEVSLIPSDVLDSRYSYFMNQDF